MRTGVVIGGRQHFYDLDRVNCLDDVLVDDELLCISPLADGLCKVRVVKVTDRGVMVEEMKDKPSAIFWKISKRELSGRVYKINNEPLEIQQ